MQNLSRIILQIQEDNLNLGWSTLHEMEMNLLAVMDISRIHSIMKAINLSLMLANSNFCHHHQWIRKMTPIWIITSLLRRCKMTKVMRSSRVKTKANLEKSWQNSQPRRSWPLFWQSCFQCLSSPSPLIEMIAWALNWDYLCFHSLILNLKILASSHFRIIIAAMIFKNHRWTYSLGLLLMPI